MHDSGKLFDVLVKRVLLILFLFNAIYASAQEPKVLTLQQAFQLAEQQYPLTGQRVLLDETENLIFQNLNSSFLPQLSINAQGSYQSEVTKVALQIPGIKFAQPPNDQYKAVAEVNQLLYDGGLIRGQQDIQKLSTSVEKNKIEVELHQLKTRISQLYFSILYHDELLEQTLLAAKDIEIGIDKVTPQVENGVLLRSNLRMLQAQLLQIEQRKIEIKAARKGLIDAFALLINQPFSEKLKLVIPAPHQLTDTIITRPEVALYQSQSKLLAGQEKLIKARNLPKANVFVQGGYGKPGLNMLSETFEPFYMSGLRLTWPLGGLYNTNRDKRLIAINRQSVDLQKETFLLNTRSQLQQQKAEINKYEALLATDHQIVQLRNEITEAAKAQLANAVITVSDYLLQVNAEDAARQSLILHQLQLAQAQTMYAITSGKL